MSRFTLIEKSGCRIGSCRNMVKGPFVGTKRSDKFLALSPVAILVGYKYLRCVKPVQLPGKS